MEHITVLEILMKPEVLSALTITYFFFFIKIKFKNLISQYEIVKEPIKYKSNYEKKTELVKDTERILEIKEEFEILNLELKNIQSKYRKKLFSFLRK